jgi:hypothetical protein
MTVRCYRKMFRAKHEERLDWAVWVFVFLVLEEDRDSLIHLLPMGFAAASVFVSAFGLGCRLVEVDSTSSIICEL